MNLAKRTAPKPTFKPVAAVCRKCGAMFRLRGTDIHQGICTCGGEVLAVENP